MNWLKALTKIITKNGRRELAKGLLEENLTPDTVTKWAMDGTNDLLARIQNKERLEAVAANVARASTLVSSLSDAIKDGKITVEEAAKVRACVTDLIWAAITPEQIDALIEKVVKYVP